MAGLQALPASLPAQIEQMPVIVLAGTDRTLALGPTDLLVGNVGDGGYGGMALTLTLQPHAARAFADFSGAQVGETITVTLCGTVLSKPRIMERIEGGQMLLMGQSAARSAAAFDVLFNGAPCPRSGLPE